MEEKDFFCLKSNRNLTLEDALITYRKKDSIEKIFHSLKNEIQIHWSSVKEFFCLKAIDFAPEAYLKFWSIYMKSISCSCL